MEKGAAKKCRGGEGGNRIRYLIGGLHFVFCRCLRTWEGQGNSTKAEGLSGYGMRSEWPKINHNQVPVSITNVQPGNSNPAKRAHTDPINRSSNRNPQYAELPIHERSRRTVSATASIPHRPPVPHPGGPQTERSVSGILGKCMESTRR